MCENDEILQVEDLREENENDNVLEASFESETSSPLRSSYGKKAKNMFLEVVLKHSHDTKNNHQE